MSTNDGFKGVSNCYVFKSQLQEYAQKVGFPTPIYETLREGPSHEPYFRSTVVVNDVRYDSLPGFSNRKASEQSAAEVALVELSNSETRNECISQPVHEMGLCKNLLQEYAQKMNYAIPSYECHKDEKRGRVTLFSCTVDIGGIKYIGAVARTKKEAEIKAARTALLAIQSTGSGSVEKSSSNGNSMYTVIPSQKKATVDSPQKTARPLKRKKRHFKKKPKKRRTGDWDNHDQGKDTGGLEVNMDGQAGPELYRTDVFGVQVTDLKPLPMEATQNFQDERSKFSGNEGELSGAKGLLTVYGNGDVEDGHSEALNFSQSDLGNPHVGLNSMICEGDITALFKEVKNISGVASMVNNSIRCLGEVPSGVDGSNQTTYETEAGQTKGSTIGA